MRLNSKKILGTAITTDSKKEILEFINRGLKKPVKTGQKTWIIVTPNPEQVVLARKNPHFAEILNRADVAIPDGIGLVWADRILNKKPHLARITGVELMEDLSAIATKEGVPIGLIGGRGGIAVGALDCLQKKYPRVIGWATEPPELGDEIQSGDSKVVVYLESVAQKIKETKTQIVLVGLGAPKQEYFIEKLKVHTSNVNYPMVFMAVGGAFDEISGRLPMPPKFIERYGLKWLWRLTLEPWRWRRQLALIQFILLVFKEKLA